jgi:hypothetical protein
MSEVEKGDAIASHKEHDAEHSNGQHVSGSALLIDKQGNVRKLPIPTANPNDPLNWKKWEKAAVIFCCCWFCASPPEIK